MQRSKYDTIALAFFLTTMFIVSACSSSESPKDQPAAPKTLTPEERVQLYQDCWKHFNDKNWTEFRKCYSDQATSEQPGAPQPTVSGADAIVTMMQEDVKAFPDERGDPQLILVNGSNVAGIYLVKGTHSGPMKGPDGKDVPPTNKKFGLLFGHAVELDETGSKVTKEFGALDSGTLLSQLGLSPLPGRPVMEAGAPSPTIVMAKNDATEAKNLETEKAQIEIWNKHDLKNSEAYLADDFVLREIAQPKDMNKAANSAATKELWKAFSDARLSLSSMWAAGDYVFMRGTLDGTNDGDFPSMKLKKTGKKISLPFMEVDRLQDDKIKEIWLFYNAPMFATQLGVDLAGGN